VTPAGASRGKELLARAGAASARGLHARAANICAMALDLALPAALAAKVRELRAESLANLGHYGDAADELSHAARLDPIDGAGARDARLGALCLKADRVAEATQALARAAASAPARGDVAGMLGEAYARAGRWDEAASRFERALLLSPSGAARVTYATALHRAGRLREAERELDARLAEAPADFDALVERARVRQGLGAPDLASIDAERAVALAPDRPETHMVLAQARLALADWETGFREYEWRLPHRGRRPRLGVPAWNGEPLAGQTLVVWTEQGHGDIIQFVRFVACAKRLCGRARLVAPLRLARLLRACDGVDELVIKDATLPVGHRHTMVMSLFHRLGLTAPLGGDRPYLEAEPARVRDWEALLASLDGDAPCPLHTARVKVAIAWQGNPSYEADRPRSMPLHALLPLLRMQGPALRFISVQKNFGREQIRELAEGARPLDVADRLDEDGDAFVDTAAVLAQVDLVVTTDTAIAHLAGALGVPTWLLLCAAPEWRWGTSGETTPWYATVRIYRQPVAGDWPAVVERVRRDLERLTLQ
jgi:tetratricopeptide (TPR) repeat protein